MTELDSTVLAEVDACIAEGTADLVALVRDLVAFDTVSVDLSPGSDQRENQEAALQEAVAARLAGLGAEIDQFEPDAAALRDHPMMPPWHHWRGRPITVGTLRGRGEGRSLIVNGHIDVVSPGDLERWTSPPFDPELHEGRLYGRGTVDMKGGLAAAIFALEALTAVGAAPAGDVVIQAVPDEETCAMGTVAVIERGYRAEAGLVPEPTKLNFWIATRGLLHGSVLIPGRSAHAEMNQPPWQSGGGVNAIEKALPVLLALRDVSADWTQRPSKEHPLLGRPLVQPTIVRGGAFISNVPESCAIDVNATYLPADADADGYGSAPREEILAAVAAAAGSDDWLAAHPPEWTWATDYPPSEIDAGEDIVGLTRAATADLDIGAVAEGIDTTYDGALLSRLAGVPSPAFGPGDLGRAHAPDEWIGVDELVLGARAYARAVLAWCGRAL